MSHIYGISGFFIGPLSRAGRDRQYVIINIERNLEQMLYIRFASKNMDTERKPQAIDLKGYLFVCKYETDKIGARHDIS